MTFSFKVFVERLIPLPVVYQTTNFSCGAAALRAVCRYYGVGPEDEGDFIAACETDPEEGTHPADIIAAARRFGLKAVGRDGLSLGTLKRLLDLGRPVICAIQAYDSDDDLTDHDSGHYVVAIGYDDQNILFQDPSIKNNRRGKLGYEDFERRWHDIDKNQRVLRHYGIVLWRHDMPEDVDFDTRAIRIK